MSLKVIAIKNMFITILNMHLNRHSVVFILFIFINLSFFLSLLKLITLLYPTTTCPTHFRAPILSIMISE